MFGIGEQCVTDLGFSHRRMPSGEGHRAQMGYDEDPLGSLSRGSPTIG
jgi:hypothetical protein